MNILILGASGMLGNSVFRVLSQRKHFDVWGTIRNESTRRYFSPEPCNRLIAGIDALDQQALIRTFTKVKPQAVINCVGLVKQLSSVNDPLVALPINAMLPHQLANLCSLAGARLIHVSTDCVFSGRGGGAYVETDFADADDVYGRSKFLGEVAAPHITLRTSIIGREFLGHRSLVEWFLAQTGSIKGYTQAVFSGLPTVEFATIIADYVLPNPRLAGLYHVGAAPISKFDLLTLIAKVFGKTITIEPNVDLVVDKSLDATKFKAETGYTAEDWETLIERMHAFDWSTKHV